MKLVPVPELQALSRGRPKIKVTSHHGKAIELATIPFPLSFAGIVLKTGNVYNVETIAGWANRGAVPATQAALRQLIPDGVIRFHVKDGRQVVGLKAGLKRLVSMDPELLVLPAVLIGGALHQIPALLNQGVASW